MKDSLKTWEQTVLWLRQQPERQALVRDCYYDDPLESAAQRFHLSEEWQGLKHLLNNRFPCNVLDIGTGRGISSYAFAQEGCCVTALEPDPGPVVGTRAIKALKEQSGLPVRIIQGIAETLPFRDCSFDLVYGRAVLHHARNPKLFCLEATRVLKPGGLLLITREHVISKTGDLKAFLDFHPLHSLYGGENAFLLKDYKNAIRSSGLMLQKTIGPHESVINYAPMSQNQFRSSIMHSLERFVGEKIAINCVRNTRVLSIIGRILSAISTMPGRHYSFLAVKR
jgi:SAM-dependent methyltransferase